MKTSIQTNHAPSPIGTYSQAIQTGTIIYLSGQIALDAQTLKMVDVDFRGRVKKVFENLEAVCKAAGGTLNHIVKLTIYLTDLMQFESVNDVMEEMFLKPYPARSTIGVAMLPKNTDVEVDAIMILD